MNVLQIDSSLYSEAGTSSRVARELARSLAAGDHLRHRDLVREPLPHLDAARFAAFTTPPEQRTLAQRAVVAESDALIDELRQADVLVLAAPMYNYGIPSQLKAWFDHVARAGVTFRYTASGPEGLLKGKKAYVVSTRGGVHAGSARDAETVHLREFLALIGFADVEFIYAEGLAMGDTARQAGLAAAHAAVARIAALPQAA